MEAQEQDMKKLRAVAGLLKVKGNLEKLEAGQRHERIWVNLWAGERGHADSVFREFEEKHAEKFK